MALYLHCTGQLRLVESANSKTLDLSIFPTNWQHRTERVQITVEGSEVKSKSVNCIESFGVLLQGAKKINSFSSFY
jgi:hypothetical protein